MTIHCPHCAAAYSFPAAGEESGACMVECPRCGTRWLARQYAGDPYRRRGVEAAAAEVSDAIVIEHVAPGLSPTRPVLRERAPRRLPLIGELSLGKAAAAVFGGAMAIVLLGAPIVAALPQASASGLPAEVDRLEFQKVRSETVQHRGVRTLLVEGEIVNRSGSDVALPAVRISLRAQNGAEVYSWLVEPSANGIAAGRSIGFRSAVAAPPSDASQVTLKLAQRETRMPVKR
jgi:hypothetical protein